MAEEDSFRSTKPKGSRPKEHHPQTEVQQRPNAARPQILDEEEVPYDLSRAEGERFVGCCVVFNVMNFSSTQHKKREGSQHDCREIIQTFKSFGFEVTEVKDPTKDVVNQTLEDVVKKYRENQFLKCFVCFILSHGTVEDDRDVFVDKDGRSAHVVKLMKMFSTTHCPEMTGKPKLFFIQACRGNELQKGVSVEAQTDAVEPECPIPCGQSDFFVSFTTTPGFISFRYTEEGSPFIQILMQLLQRFGTKENIDAIHRRTTRHAGKLKFPDGAKICPCSVTTLIRPLIFSTFPEMY